MITVNGLKQLKIFMEYNDSRIEEVILPINENTECVQFINSPRLQLLHDDQYLLKEEEITIKITYKNPIII